MSSTPVEVIAAIRAKWLAETAGALAHAEDLLRQAGAGYADAAVFAELLLRIGVATREVELLRASHRTRPENDPQWINLSVWDAGLGES